MSEYNNECNSRSQRSDQSSRKLPYRSSATRQESNRDNQQRRSHRTSDDRSRRIQARTESTYNRRTYNRTSNSRNRSKRHEVSSSNRSYKRYFPVLLVVAGIVLIALLAWGISSALKSCSSQSESESTEAQSTEATFDEVKKYTVSFVSTGDLIFWREVADYIDLYGGASAMDNIDEYVADADVTIANLESPLSYDDSEPVYDKDVYIIGRPEAIESISNSGIDIVSLANNHIMDYTGPALQDTLDALDEIGVAHAGAGMTEREAEAMVEYEVNGASIAFFAWTDIVPNYFVAYGDEPGVVSARLNMDDALRRVREAKQTHDIVIVAMHWGVEYQYETVDYLQDDPAHDLVDAGADVVLGNHPHSMQGVEFYHGSLIAYAQGNCVFCQVYDGTHESYLLNFDITEEGVSNVVATPLYLSDDYGIPDFATGEQAQQQLETLRDISDGRNVQFEIVDGKAYITPIE